MSNALNQHQFKPTAKVPIWGNTTSIQMTNIETSNIVLQRVESTSGIYTLDALLEDADESMADNWLRARMIESFLQSQKYYMEWGKTRQRKVVSYQPINKSINTEAKKQNERVDWDVSPEAILQRLSDQSTSEQELDEAVLFAGATAFTNELRPQLLSSLSSYIDQHRFTQDDERITVVGCAARKYAMNMDEPDFEKYGDWLLPGQTDYLNHRVELEFVKGICWRLIFEPLSIKGSFPKLTEVLFEIAENYTNSRSLLQENFAAISLNAIVSVFVLDVLAGIESHAYQLWKNVIKADRAWFIEMQHSRLLDAVNSIGEHDKELSESVHHLVEIVCITSGNG